MCYMLVIVLPQLVGGYQLNRFRLLFFSVNSKT